MTRSAKIGVIGLGPAGLGAAIGISTSALASETICIDAGVGINERRCELHAGKGCLQHSHCRVVCGFGGASLLSGGKISQFPAGRGMALIIGNEAALQACISDGVSTLSRYVAIDALSGRRDSAVIEKATSDYASLGFDFRYYDSYSVGHAQLLNGYMGMIDDMRDSGMCVVPGVRVTSIIPCHDGHGYHLYVSDGGCITVEQCIIAIGRSGGWLSSNLSRSIGRQQEYTRLDVGIRIEFPSYIWPDIDVAHNDLKLLFDGARTFCVCKDGYLSPYWNGETMLLEGGGDLATRSGFTNLAITTRLPLAEGRYCGETVSSIIAKAKQAGDGKPVSQPLNEYLGNASSYTVTQYQLRNAHFAIPGDVNDCFPRVVSSQLRDIVELFASRLLRKEIYSAITVYAPEIDYYWPTFSVDSNFCVDGKGIYAIGDCTGKFRGILQAFSSGLRCGNELAKVSYVS